MPDVLLATYIERTTDPSGRIGNQTFASLVGLKVPG